MSFFGFDTTLPRDGPAGDSHAMLEEPHDPFLRRRGGGQGDDEYLDFEDTYDGLGNQLDETGDEDNDETFGGGRPETTEPLGCDFDFAAHTADVRGALLEEQALHHARQPFSPARAPPPPPQKPARSGYEAYTAPQSVPKLEADASIWGLSAAKPAAPATQPQPPPGTGAAKMMSLEEVEAAMRAHARPSPAPPLQPAIQSQTPGPNSVLGRAGAASAPTQPHHAQPRPPQILQRPQHVPRALPAQPSPHHNGRAPDGLHAPGPSRPQDGHGLLHAPGPSRARDGHGPPPPPMPFPHRPPGFPHGPPGFPHAHLPRAPAPAPAPAPPGHARGPSYHGPPITQAQHMMSMPPEERAACVEEDAKRAKRNHKIFLLSKNNGLMTPQDKNFITRIQLQQLLTATGGVDHEPGSEEQLAEDFYYQVYAQIRGPPRSRPGQPLNPFAQTYLFHTGSRYGYGRSRHHPRGGDNHVQRMEQQVARAVEAAKARPKNKSLVMEGSLGKIAFSNSKTPRPLLNIKRPDSADMRKHGVAKPADRKTALRDIETLYSTLMRVEDHERKQPLTPHEGSPSALLEAHMRWRSEMQELNQQLWESLKVMVEIQHHLSAPHPFIQIISHGKGKKVIPRAFRHLIDQQRLTMLTRLVIHLDALDVIRDAYPPADNSPLPARVRDEVELFGNTVIPPLSSYVGEAPLHTIIGLLGLVLDRTHVQHIVRTKIGLSILTTLIARAELLKQSPGDDDFGGQWQDTYARLFDTLEPVLPYIFPTDTTLAASDDVHVWHYLAVMAAGATPDQQQRLVLGVKDRVMETVAVSKTLPEDMSQKRLADVNLFMRAIGLDVELLG